MLTNVVRLRFPQRRVPSPPSAPDFGPGADRLLMRLWTTGARPGAIFAEMAAIGWTGADVNKRLHELFGLAGADGSDEAGPVERAAFVLNGGALRDASAPGGWRVNGVAVRPETVVAIANQVLAFMGKPTIAYPGAATCHGRPAGALGNDLSGKGGRG